MSAPNHPLVNIDRAERITWRIQRASWLFVAGLLIPAALLGAFGAGWIATARTESNGATLLHERVMRVGVAREWELQLPVHGDTIDVNLDHRFLDDFRVDDWTPLPSSASSTSAEFTASFSLQSPELFRVRFRVVPRSIGIHSIGITSGSSRWESRVLVLP